MGVLGFEKKCDQCGKRIEGQAEDRYYRTFCSKEHLAQYFGAYIEGESSDFPTAKETSIKQPQLHEKMRL